MKKFIPIFALIVAMFFTYSCRQVDDLNETQLNAKAGFVKKYDSNDVKTSKNLSDSIKISPNNVENGTEGDPPVKDPIKW